MLILPLSREFSRDFDCGDEDLNIWFKRIAWQHKAKRISSTFVAVPKASSTEALGFYAISLSEIRGRDLPEPHQNRLPNHIPVFRLGRLATATAFQRQGIGEFLLIDAINRTKSISDEASGVGLEVFAKPDAARFYTRYGFVQLMDHPNHQLFLF